MKNTLHIKQQEPIGEIQTHQRTLWYISSSRHPSWSMEPFPSDKLINAWYNGRVIAGPPKFISFSRLPRFGSTSAAVLTGNF